MPEWGCLVAFASHHNSMIGATRGVRGLDEDEADRRRDGEPTGKSLIPPALALAGWAIEHVPHIEASRAAYQTRAE
ncbi:hypothetical protein V6V47_00720 [Micromonospora sp. CPCC 205539]|uniref:hypothetical protein n=1 Tax=Micromonospora sp. CPCC 205539 TaxID=3122408 RepID=UPI002FF1A9F4